MNEPIQVSVDLLNAGKGSYSFFHWRMISDELRIAELDPDD